MNAPTQEQMTKLQELRQAYLDADEDTKDEKFVELMKFKIDNGLVEEIEDPDEE